MSEIKYGLIHCHSENSMKDSVMTVTELVKVAKELGSPAVTLTDHGVMSGIFELFRAAKEYGIKPIPGVEAYIQEDSENSRKHLVLLAKNYIGYKAICRAVTASNTRINSVPTMNLDILEKYFGEGTSGHGNVIATSACVGGVLSSILLHNQDIDKEISKVKDKQSKYSNPNAIDYIENKKILADYDKEIENLRDERDKLKALADKKYTMRERGVEKLKDNPEYESLLLTLNNEKAESQQAHEKLPEVKKQLSTTTKRATSIRKICKSLENEHKKYDYFKSEIDLLLNKKKPDDDLYFETKNMASRYVDIFGKDNFYIELQYHGISKEEFVMPILVQIADELNIPLVAANDVHCPYNTKECVRARSLVNSLRFNRWMPPRDDDSEYYVKTDKELSEWLLRILPENIVNKAFLGIKNIVDACNVELPTNTHFPSFVNNVNGETSSQRLRRMTEEGIKEKFPNGFPYRDRVEYELKIIEDMKYTDYLCIVQDYIAYARKEGMNNEEGVGYAVGPGRGSAAGSLVCYLIGITRVNPMPLDLLFERFLNPDRVSYPDIDVDFANYIRDDVYSYIQNVYGEKAVCSIMTKSTAAGRKSIDSVARIRGDELYGDISRFYDLAKSIKKLLPDANASLSKCKEELLNAFSDNEDAQAIINDASLIEGASLTYSVHAAGAIIADNGDVGEYIPLMYNTDKNIWTTQCDMIESEKQACLLKFDLLGLKTLDIISMTLRYIKRNKGISIDIEKIPQDPLVFKEIFAKGKTNMVFQFESQGMQSMLKRFKPENINHIVLLVAAYRPGPMQFINGIIDVKNGNAKAKYICEEAKEILSPTYSYPIYQEQIVQLCNKVAGFTLAEADTIRRYMSKKNESAMAKYKPKFVEGLQSKKVSKKDAEEFWEQLMKFAEYGFNKSHAAVYAYISYYTAWLKYHYPAEYMTAVMNYSDIDKLPMVIHECKALGLQLIPPHINKSDVKFSCKGNSILFGLSNIKGVAGSAESILEERKNGDFISFKDFLLRVKIHQNTLCSLIDTGALDCWCSNRVAMKVTAPILFDYLKNIRNAEKALVNEKSEKKINNLNNKIQNYTESFNTELLPISVPEDKLARLSAEKELLGMYVSGHPLDEYPIDKLSNISKIVSITESKQYLGVAGIISNFKIVKRKRDGANMAFFTLEDKTDSINICCFAEAFNKFGHLLKDGIVVSVFGKTDIDVKEDESIEKSIIAEYCNVIEQYKKTIVVTVKNIGDWTDVYEKIKTNATTGLPVVVYVKEMSEFRETNLKLPIDVLNCDFENAVFSVHNLY